MQHLRAIFPFFNSHQLFPMGSAAPTGLAASLMPENHQQQLAANGTALNGWTMDLEGGAEGSKEMMN
jgi:hypothetical protein